MIAHSFLVTCVLFLSNDEWIESKKFSVIKLQSIRLFSGINQIKVLVIDLKLCVLVSKQWICSSFPKII